MTQVLALPSVGSASRGTVPCDSETMRQLYKIRVAIGFAVTAAIVGQVAWNMASPDGAGLGWPALVFAAVGGLVGWYRTG